MRLGYGNLHTSLCTIIRHQLTIGAAPSLVLPRLIDRQPLLIVEERELPMNRNRRLPQRQALLPDAPNKTPSREVVKDHLSRSHVPRFTIARMPTPLK